MEYKIEESYKGTRILLGETAKKKRQIIDVLSKAAIRKGFEEIFLPSIELSSLYTDKAGEEVLNQTFNWKDKSDRDVCLRPEGTATCQKLANAIFKYQKDVKIFYTAQCWRYEQPQAGRYREFTQFGIEWLNPSNSEEALEEVKYLAKYMTEEITTDYEFSDSVKRGLAYYTDGGFEIKVNSLGAQKQILGGGPYKEGVGFAFGVDRLLIIK